MGDQSLSNHHRMRLFLLSLVSLVSLSYAQFTFFGGSRSQFRQPQRFQGFRGGFQGGFQGFHQPAPPAPAPSQALRSGRIIVEESGAGGAQNKGNYQFDGKNYLLTWRTGRNNFDWTRGVQYCKSQGMDLISLDTEEKVEHFLGLVVKERAPYFWTGGQVSPDNKKLSWQNGETEAINKGKHPWSFTGRTGPQPDGGERCLAVLNNTYRDGAKYHDVACHHMKPVICEEV